MKRSWYVFLSMLVLPFFCFAGTPIKHSYVSEPTSCVTGTFSKTGDANWSTVYLSIKNTCNQTVDLQNMKATFLNSSHLNTSFWGNFGPISYPDNVLQIISEPEGNKYLAQFSLHIPEASWANSKLPNGQSITIIYGTPHADYEADSVKIYLSVSPSTGKINIKNGPLPNAISGYTSNPSVTLTQIDTGSSYSKVVAWNTTALVDGLQNNKSFRFATPDILFNNHRCIAHFLPTTAQSSTSSPPLVLLSYQCSPVAQVSVALRVSGLTSATSSVNVFFTPNSGTPITKQVPLTAGTGNTTVMLSQGVAYTVSATTVSDYSASFIPQPLIANSGTTESITYTKMPSGSGGRMISYIPGWKQPPNATELKNAGYTHAMVAFGVFSTAKPGTIVSAFDTVTKSYIDSLHAVGIKVLLSLGGALTSIPNTSVDFHQVLQMAQSPSEFQATFIQSLKGLINQYGFDGFDIDIEHGIIGAGPFQNPTGDIPVLASIINRMHADLPSLLITLTPQTANIGATRSFDAVWGNYSALIMQTYNSLSWVGIQLYNSGCILGIDQVCYDPNATNTPNFSVAMAVDLLADWPAVDGSGRPTNFQPYISHLRADQIVLGYPAPNAQGGSDGLPVTPTTTIKRAVQCLKSGVANSLSCGTYVPPKAYGLIGGVFNWEITYDQNNQYKFARDLKACVTTGACN